MLDSIIYSFIGSLYSFLFQNAATDEKSCLEEEQRAAARDRKERCYEHIPKYFEHDDNTGGMDLFFTNKFLVDTLYHGRKVWKSGGGAGQVVMLWV